jgi:hypothetical protein
LAFVVVNGVAVVGDADVSASARDYIIALACIYKSPLEDTDGIRITASSASDCIIAVRIQVKKDLSVKTW